MCTGIQEKVLKSARWKACSMLDKSPAVCSKEIFNQLERKSQSLLEDISTGSV